MVTGASGFIGGVLVRALMADGEDVRALVRTGTDARALETAGATVVRGDVADPAAVHAAADGCEVVYNLAVSPRLSHGRVLGAVNVTGARNAALAAATTGARLVHASTVAVYGPLVTLPAGEDHPTRPERPYPRSKLAGERAVAEVAGDGAASVAIARIGLVYGPGNRGGIGGLPRTLGPLTPLIGGGRHLVDMVYVDDIVDGLRACGARREPGLATYNLTGGAPVPVHEALATIAAAGGGRLRPLPLPRAPFAAAEAVSRHVLWPRGIDSRLQHRLMRAPRSQAYRIARAADDLGYRPAVGLADGIGRTLAWHRDGPIGRT